MSILSILCNQSAKWNPLTDLQELQGLQALEYQMSHKLKHLHVKQDSALYSRTFWGRILNFESRVFVMLLCFPDHLCASHSLSHFHSPNPNSICLVDNECPPCSLP
jgi:hypothetical protein